MNKVLEHLVQREAERAGTDAGLKEMEPDSSQGHPVTEQHKLKYRKFHLNIRKNPLFSVSVPRESVDSPSLETFKAQQTLLEQED